MAEGNALLKIGFQVDKMGMADVQAAINMIRAVGAAVVATVEKLDTYVEAMRKVDMSVVNFADDMSAMQVGSLNLMKSLGTLNNLGIKTTREEFAAMSVAAQEFSEVWQEDAGAVMGNLTDALIKGNERGLKPFGIEIDKTNKSVSAIDQAFKQLTDRFGGKRSGVDNLTDSITATKNGFVDLFGAVWDGVTTTQGPVTSFFSAISNGANEAAAALTEMTGAQKEYFWSLQFIADNIKTTLDKIPNIGEYLSFGFGSESDAFSDVFRAPGESAAMDRLRTLAEINAVQEDLVSVKASNPETREKNTFGMARGGGGEKELTDYEKEEYIQQLFNEWMAKGRGGKRVDFQPNLDQQIAQDTMGFDVGQGGEVANPEGKYANVSSLVDFRLKMKEEELRLEQELEAAEAKRMATYGKNQAANLEMMGMAVDLEMSRSEQIVEQIRLENERTATQEESAESLIAFANDLEAAWDSVKSSISRVAQAYEQGTKDMSALQATFYYIDAAIGVISETAKAAAAFASERYTEGALHLVAVGSYVATMALAAAHGGSSGAGSSGSGSASAGVAATAGRYSGGYNESSRLDTLQINIIMDSTSKAWGLLVEENDRALQSGGPAFQKAA